MADVISNCFGRFCAECSGQTQLMKFLEQPEHTGPFPSHFFFLFRQVKQPVLVLSFGVLPLAFDSILFTSLLKERELDMAGLGGVFSVVSTSYILDDQQLLGYQPPGDASVKNDSSDNPKLSLTQNVFFF